MVTSACPDIQVVTAPIACADHIAIKRTLTHWIMPGTLISLGVFGMSAAMIAKGYDADTES